MVLETMDSQLDFSTFKVKSKDPYQWELIQVREVVARPLFRDPIKKAYMIYEDGLNFSIALRYGGGIDVYWNM